MAHDLVLRGGTVVDGTGAPARAADVAVDGGVVSEVGPPGSLDAGGAGEVIDAGGLLVTPGWVDVHSHYDGQAFWDDVLAPTSWHGVTTVVMGNCGVGFAPAAPDRHEWLIRLMEAVEDIPGRDLAAGIDFTWETFPEYLDALARRRYALDIGTQVPHAALRAYVMGERGARNESATDDDLARMKAIVQEAVTAGALGFSTSRTLAHVTADGDPIPGTFADERELLAIAAGLGECGRGVIEVAPLGSAGEDASGQERELEWMERVSAASGRPVSFVLLQVDAAPDLWRGILDRCAAAEARGAALFAQVAGRPTGLLSGHQTTYTLFDPIPAYAELRSLPFADLLAALRRPDVRARIVGFEGDAETRARYEAAFAVTYVMGTPPDYEPGPDRTLAAIAAREHRNPLEVAYDAMLADDGRGMLYVPILGYSGGDSEPVREMVLHPRSILSLADGGAHVGVICDASMPTYMLTHWTRDRTRGARLPLELIVRKQTHDTARLYGLADRGTIEPGMLGDLNVIDYEGLVLENPEMRADLPAGGRRLVQRARGYVATVKRGVVTFRDGADTGARPGSLVRG